MVCSPSSASKKIAWPGFGQAVEPILGERVCGAQMQFDCAFSVATFAGEQCGLSKRDAIEHGPFLFWHRLVVPIRHVDERQRRLGVGLGVGFTLLGFGFFILIGFGVGRFRCPYRHLETDIGECLAAARIGVEPIAHVAFFW